MIRNRIKLAASTAAAAAILGGLAMGTAPAFAATAAGPGCTGTACEVDGSVTVAAAITLAMPTTTFNDGSVLAGQTSPNPMIANPATQFSASVVSGDTKGYVLTAIAGADFTSGGNNFPASNLTLFEAGTGNFNNNWSAGNGGTQYQLPEAGTTPVTIASRVSPTPVGGDNSNYATSVSVPASSPAGSYTVPVLFAAIGS